MCVCMNMCLWTTNWLHVIIQNVYTVPILCDSVWAWSLSAMLLVTLVCSWQERHSGTFVRKKDKVFRFQCGKLKRSEVSSLRILGEVESKGKVGWRTLKRKVLWRWCAWSCWDFILTAFQTKAALIRSLREMSVCAHQDVYYPSLFPFSLFLSPHRFFKVF